MSRQTLLIDFDGTLHEYHGWDNKVGPEERMLNPPLENARHACHILSRDYRLVCFTTRPVEMVERWLRTWGFPSMKVTNYKEPAHAIIDDRAIQFTGAWTEDLLRQIRDFQPHWRKQPLQQPACKEEHQSLPPSGASSDAAGESSR